MTRRWTPRVREELRRQREAQAEFERLSGGRSVLETTVLATRSTWGSVRSTWVIDTETGAVRQGEGT